MPAARRRVGHPGHVLALGLILATLWACQGAPTPAPPPQPSPRPSATPGPERVLDGSLYTISLDGVLIATEKITARVESDQLQVFSELSRTHEEYPIVERRTLVLTPLLNPISYEVERSALGARSTWGAETSGDTVNLLNNNLAWYAPVLVERLVPPLVYLDSAPSALPFALLALRYGEKGGTVEPATPQQWRELDIMEDYPMTRPITMTIAPDRKGAVIGTFAIEGVRAADLGTRNPRFTVWVRPNTRTLYSAEIDDYRLGLWDQQAYPALRRAGKLVVQRVSTLPQVPKKPVVGEASAGAAPARVAFEFSAADKTRLSGTLILPAGSGPFPCLVLHSPGGVVPRWDAGDAWAARGWAVLCYDKRGLGASKGEYNHGPLKLLAQDALAAASALRERPEVDAKRIVFVGLGEGGQVGALALASGEGYAGAILASCASTGPAFPAQAAYRVQKVLAPFYGWDAARLAAYEKISIKSWQDWLTQNKDEVVLLRRRASLQALKDLAGTDLAQALTGAKAPVLLLHGAKDTWTPVEGARALQEQLNKTGASRVTLRVFEGLGADLRPEGVSDVARSGAFAPEVEEAMLAWLSSTLKP